MASYLSSFMGSGSPEDLEKEADSKVDMPSEDDLESLPEPDRLAQAAQASKAAASAQGIVESLKGKAALMTDPKQREQVMREVFENEMKAHGNSKKARVLKSGTFQGAAGGAGIGAATGMGVGTVVGTVVGITTSIPTMALGGLVGAGTGVFHGPFIKMAIPGQGKNEGDKEEMVKIPQQAIDSGAVQVDEKTGKGVVKDPEALQKAAAAAIEQGKKSGKNGEPRRKPKKLEVRSGKTQQASPKSASSASSDATQRKKPKKLEIRSKSKQGA